MRKFGLDVSISIPFVIVRRLFVRMKGDPKPFPRNTIILGLMTLGLTTVGLVTLLIFMLIRKMGSFEVIF